MVYERNLSIIYQLKGVNYLNGRPLLHCLKP